uniref:Kinesin motor domain-containing protein n=1 Tax=Trichobilharzia regenti TaxID=157069 RepID=A0AA85KEC9_TRIRE|nr:unnamed protein product [Trichobilharzia regenti]
MFGMDLDDGKSALSFICPRVPSLGTVNGFRLSTINCNLLADFESCSRGPSISPHSQPMKVFLRIRPYACAKDSSEKTILSCPDSYTVVAYPPEADFRKNQVRNFQKSANKFTFNGIFHESTTQKKVFEKVAADKIRSFIDGLNGLIFAYGTTSSGKTHTLQGSRSDAGIVPRSLQAIFTLVKHKSDPFLMPKDFSDVISLSEEKVQEILTEKSNLLKYSEGIFESTPLTGSENEPSCLDETFTDMRCSSDIRYSFWISFVEIYNETFYDLLDSVQCSNMFSSQSNGTTGQRTAQNQQNFRNIFNVNNNASHTTNFTSQPRRKPLELRTDKNGNIFVKGMKWYPIGSPEEALRLVAVGRQCQKVASTRLNQASSRSHSILSIKAVKVVDKNNPNFARVSTLMFCDLAGSERSVKAATGGQTMRMREAGNINSSLLTLGRCIECLRYNQLHPDNPKLVPYRDSKLTRLFQGFFTGQGRACMIVNASPNPELYDETLHALRFAAIARQVIVEANPIAETVVLHTNNKSEVKPNLHQEVKHKILLNNQTTAIKSKESDTILEAQSTRWSEDDIEKTAFSRGEEEKERGAGISDEMNSTVEFHQVSSTEAVTPSNSDGTELMLEQFSKKELIALVKDLSEKFFESKGELIEQEARLRAEMCDNLNQQIIDFENKFEELLKSRENYLYEESNTRMRNIINSVNQLQAAYQSNHPKRLCPDDSEVSSDEDISDTENDGKDYSSVNENRRQEVRDCCSAQTLKITQLTKTLKDSEDRVAELESDLAEQKDVIENLMREVDRLRVESRRLEFTIVQQQQTNTFNNTSSKVADLDDSCITINLAKLTLPSSTFVTKTDHSMDKFESFSFHKSSTPQKNATKKATTPQVDDEDDEEEEAPLTVVKGNYRLLTKETTITTTTNDKPCLTIHSPILHEKALQSIHEDEVKIIHPKNKYIISDARESRISEGLQSFLEHEASIQNQEALERLRRQIYEIEEKFANKHDALVKSETAFNELKTRYDDLSQRFVTQANDLQHSTSELAKLKQLHQKELEAYNIDAQKRIDELKADLKTALDRNAEYLSHIPEINIALQTTFNSEPSILSDSISIQTSVYQMNDLSIQVCPVNLDVSIQTDQLKSIENLKPKLDCSKPTAAAAARNNSNNHNNRCNEELNDESDSMCITTSEHHQQQQPVVKRNLRNNNNNSTTTSRLQLKINRGRLTHRFGPPPKVPEAPSPIVSLCLSDSELEISGGNSRGGGRGGNQQMDKENLNTTCETDNSDDDRDHEDHDDDVSDNGDDDDEVQSCKSEPIGGGNTRRQHTRRNNNNTKKFEKASTTKRTTRQRRKQTHSSNTSSTGIVLHRRLPPLAESTQLLPDSMFQDELDEALMEADIEIKKVEQRNLRQLNLRQAPRRRR